MDGETKEYGKTNVVDKLSLTVLILQQIVLRVLLVLLTTLQLLLLEALWSSMPKRFMLVQKHKEATVVLD